MGLNQLIEHLLTADNYSATTTNIKSCIENLSLVPSYPIILVGGTNGKGSVCAYLTTMLTLGGYNVGAYTSPHVFKYNERISINNNPVDDTILASALEEIINCSNNLKSESPVNLGLFKAFTLAAHLIFIKKKVDVAIIEVGIGGAKDVTNLFEPDISAITNVTLDHCDLLGNTVEEIALEKSGIYRSNKPSFYGALNPPKTLIEYTAKHNINLEVYGTDFGVTRQEFSFDVWCNNKNYYSLPYPALRGNSQPDNAAMALAILNKLHLQFPMSNAVIKTGLLQATLTGRFQVLPGTPQIILDVAHNSHSVTNMLQNMIKLPFAPQSVAVFGIAKDKDATEIIRLCKNSFDKWFIAKTNQPRGLDAEKIVDLLKEAQIPEQNIIKCDSIAMAYLKASECANARITCFGSFLVVEEAYNTILSTRK